MRALFIATILITCTAAGAGIVFTQPADPTGGSIKSAWYAPDGMDGDMWAWDNFTLDTTQSINHIAWRGAYTHYLSGAGKAPVYDFTISLHASTAANTEPDVVHPPLAQFQVSGNANETLAGTFGGVLMYDYSFNLPTSFVAQASTKYWVMIGVGPMQRPAWAMGHTSRLLMAAPAARCISSARATSPSPFRR
jgi:hypothetical protein